MVRIDNLEYNDNRGGIIIKLYLNNDLIFENNYCFM